MYKSLSDVELVIALSKPVEVIDMFVESYLQGIEYDKWCEDKQAEYGIVYKTLLVEEDCISFTDWLNETKVVSEAIYEDDILVAPEAIEYVRAYEPIEVDVFGWKVANYELLRKYNYPPMEDYLDAIVKSDIEAQEAYINKCLEVKARFPKE